MKSVKLLFDTSVLVATMVQRHDAHERAFPWLERVVRGSDQGVVSAHTIAELYAVLTTLPLRPILQPHAVRELIEHNVISQMEVVTLARNDYIDVLDHLVEQSLTGGITYDALIAWVARKSEVDCIVTLNPKDFKRVLPLLGDKVIVP